MEEDTEVLTTDIRYYYTGETTVHDDLAENGRDMKRREGVWASLVRDSLYNNDLGGNDDTDDNNDVRGSRFSNLRIPATMLSFHNSQAATKVCEFLKDLDFPSIPHVFAKLDDTTVVVEKIPEVLFMEWLKAPKEPMWTVDSTGTQCLELNGRYSDIFRCIVATLTYLHSRGKCHGNLKNGIFVTGQEEDHRIGFTNFNINIRFEMGLKKDLADLKSLMETAFTHAQPIKIGGRILPEPPALKSFYDLFKGLNQLRDFAEYRDFATFIYWAPIFYNWHDRKDFFDVVEQFSLQDDLAFAREVVNDNTRKSCTCTRKKEDLMIHTCKNHAIPSMNGWASRVSQSTSQLWLLLTYCPKGNAYTGVIQNIYKNSGGIYQFHRNCLHHYKSSGNKDSSQCALEDLLNQFPDAIPAIFKALIDKFHRQTSSVFGKSLTAFLKEAKRSGAIIRVSGKASQRS